ncbi:hypothetical protein EYF80_025978 [Liparis tanakae]|uniref:Uncharacterized protein n=1 Tax=Liparis tanakae TaxID=230148 RepID=A0A4Z2HDJ5_9TELE|nr:hypothetical protein EYF80_025978 [Liparis tanakae]
MKMKVDTNEGKMAGGRVGSRMNAARLCQYQLFANLPGRVCVPMGVWWEAPTLEARRVVHKPRAGLVSGQVKLCGDYSLAY